MKISSVDLAQLLSDLFYCDQCEQCLADYRQTGLCKILNNQKKINIIPETFYTDYPFITAYINCKFSYTKCTECVFQTEYKGICTCTSRKSSRVIDNEMERLMQSGQELEILNFLPDNCSKDTLFKATIDF